MPKIYTQKEIEKCINLYILGKSTRKIEETLNISKTSVLRFLKNAKIKRRETKETSRKDFFNYDYFENIDTEDKAYFLGLLMADGNVCIKRGKVIQISLKNEDSYILKLFQNKIGSTNNLCIDRVLYSKLTLYSDKMVKDLIKLGCTTNKSHTLKFPTKEQVPERFISHFIRGYFDGDGGISLYKHSYCASISFTSNKLFLESLSTNINKYIDIKFSKYYKRYKEKEISCGSIHYHLNPKKDKGKLFFWLYKDCKDMYLKRKKNKFETLLSGRILIKNGKQKENILC